MGFRKNKGQPEEGLLRIEVVLMQIYGELNRIRQIMAEDSEVGQAIADFDMKNNGYEPFFDSEVNYNKFKAAKRKK